MKNLFQVKKRGVKTKCGRKQGVFRLRRGAGLALLLLIFGLSFFKLLSGWGALTGAQSHKYIVREAYKKLRQDPAYPGSKFPTLDQVLAHEGVNWVMSLFEGGFLTGPGPDSAGNSMYTEHYYNPRTNKGGGPGACATYYKALVASLEARHNIGPTLTTVVEHDAAYLAHFIADMSVPYHINGMPAAEALAKIRAGDGMLGEDIVGPTGKGPEDWLRIMKAWESYYKKHKDANWFDPWYWDGWISADKTSTHLKWEGNYGPTWVTSSHTLRGYSQEFSSLQQRNGNGDPANIDNFARLIAQTTNANQKATWGFMANAAVSHSYDHAITNVYTAWRAAFSALRPDFYVEEDPQTGEYRLVVKIKNVEDSEAARDVNVKITVTGGRLDGPDTHTLTSVPANSEIEIKDIWKVEKTSDDVKVLIEVTGKFTETPDSGKAIVERELKLLIPTYVNISPSLVDEVKRHWKLEVEVLDNKGQPVDKGEVKFTATGGSFAPTAAVLEYQIGLNGGRYTKAWRETDKDQQVITVRYLGDKSDPQTPDEIYRESEAKVTLPPDEIELSTVFVIDASGSMSGSKLAAAKAAVRAALANYQGVSDKEEWALYAFFDCGSIQRLQGFTSDPAQITSKLGFNASGSTPIADSLMTASNYLRGGSARGKKGRIILLTDGGENCRGDPVDAAKSIVAKKYFYNLSGNQ